MSESTIHPSIYRTQMFDVNCNLVVSSSSVQRECRKSDSIIAATRIGDDDVSILYFLVVDVGFLAQRVQKVKTTATLSDEL